MQANQSAVGAKPEVAVIVLYNLVGDVVGQSLLFGVAGKIIALAVVAADATPVGGEGEDGVPSWPSIARFVNKMSFTSPISFSRGEKASSPLMVAI